MPKATIHHDVDMQAWPTRTWLVELEEPIKRFSVETGELQDEFAFVAVNCKESIPVGAYVFPSTETGGFVDEYMVPLRTSDVGLLHSVLIQLGYTPTN
jgi:hypothetical protein